MRVQGMLKSGASAAVMLAVVALGAGCGSSGSSAAATTPHDSSQWWQLREHAHSQARMVSAKKSKYGTVLFASDGKVLYVFGSDNSAHSTCYDECATAWPPVTTKSMPMAESGLDQSLLGTTRRNDGTLQVTYDGHPLYTYSGDQPGQIMCQNANMHGGLWLVISAMGMPVHGGGSAM